MGYMGSYYSIPKAIFYLLKGDYRIYRVCSGFIVLIVQRWGTPALGISDRPFEG